MQLAYTYFSPSARAFADSLDVDFRDVLPFDVASDMRAVLAALAPTALVFSKLDVWPTLAREAARRGTRLGLVSATLAATSSRRSGLASALLREAYSRLDRVGAVSTEDADRLIALGERTACAAGEQSAHGGGWIDLARRRAPLPRRMVPRRGATSARASHRCAA
jgi:3-deoxy-D-manno-octulosonic-acid transferase